MQTKEPQITFQEDSVIKILAVVLSIALLALSFGGAVGGEAGYTVGKHLGWDTTETKLWGAAIGGVAGGIALGASSAGVGAGAGIAGGALVGAA